MKKRLLAMLLVLMLVVSLLPVGALADDATVVGDYVTVSVETGSYKNNLTVNVYDPSGNLLETLTSDQARTSDCEISINLGNDNYLIENVDKTGDGSMSEIADTAISSDRKSYNNRWSATGQGGKNFTLNVYLRANPTDTPETPEGVYDGGATVSFRAYIPQMLKLLYCENPSLVNDNTEITGVEMFFREAFGYGQSESFADINREEDYFNTVLSNETGKAVPANVSEIRISYKNGDTEGVASIKAGDLSFVYHSGVGHYYSIESSNHTVHVVYFYNETDGHTGNNYFQYAVRFVNHGESLGEDMPADPDYGTGNTYRFVNWEQGRFDGSGAPFFSTTVVEDDLTVFARKVSSSEYGGSEIHVMNPDNALLNRVVERYNENSDTTINVDDIDRDSVKINANDAAGNTTNKDYYNNEWRSYNSVEYYWVCNYRAPSGVANLTNTHIGYDDITGINVYFTVNGGEEQSVYIPVGENPGEIAKSLDNTETIIELRVISGDEGGEEPGPGPDEPEEFTLTTSADSNSTIDEGKTFKYSEEGTITVNFSANTGYKIATVTVDGSALTGDALASAIENGFVTVDMKSNHSVGVTSEAKTSDWQTVQVVIYRNGDTTKPYATIDVPGYKTGDTIYTEDFDINDYYTKDKFATAFVFDGWFDDGRWNNYKDAGCPEEDFTTVDEIYVNGWKNVIAMVWDVYPVNYHVLDEDGNEIDNKTDYITERDLAGYGLWDYSKAGHTFDGWYENDKDIGNDSKKEPVPLAPLKKYELYGLCDPIPQHLEIYAAIDKNKEEAVKIYSGMVDYGAPLVAYLETLDLETDVFPGYSPEDGKWYKYDSPEWTFGENDTVSGWTNVLINYVPNEYTIYYHGNGGLYKGEHDQVSSTFNYGSTATIKNNVFEKAGYVFIGWALSAEGGVGDVVYTGGEDVTFNTETFPGLLANGNVDLYAVWAEDKLGGGDDGNEPDGTPDYRQVFVKYVAADENGVVTPSFNTFDLEVDENGKVMTDVDLSLEGVATPNADATFAYWTIEGLGYDGGAYSYEADLSGEDFTGYVAGETYTFTAYFNGPVVKPEQPNVYEIYVTVRNGTATFCGSEVTSHILAAENEDITITFTPDEGYTLDYATIDDNMLLIPDDGVYTLKLVDSDHTIEVFYESDKIGTEDPNEGDGVPDKYQATVNFVAGENGKVTGNVTKVYTIFGADGKYAEEGVITPSLNGVTVTPDEGYKVDGWTNAAGERVNPESEITVEGGDVVVFTVNFQSDPSLKEITSFEKKLVTDRKTYHSFGLRVPTFIRNGSTVVVDEGKGVTLLYAISLTGTPGAEYAITDTGADVADGYALTGVIPETGVVTVYVTKDFTWREAAAAAYKDDALVNTAAVELTDNPNEPGQESTEEVDVVIDWDDPNVPVVPSDPDDDDDEDEDDEVFVPKWLNTEDHYSYIVGYEDGTIKPNNNITRAEVATIFFRLLTDDARARYWSQTNDYTDVAADSWYNNAISTLSNMGIINGYEDGTFQPNASITRAEFTAIATRFFDYTAEYDGAFNDVSRSAWYADCVQAAVDMGLVDGYPDGGFHPNSNITRAEAVTIVNRVLNRAPHEDHLLDEDEMNVWPDNVYGAWYYADMQEATNSHDYDWIRVSGECVEE